MPTDLLGSSTRPAHALIGRQSELGRLTGAIGVAGRDSGDAGPVRHAVVAGEAGIGKSRLLSALAEPARRSGRRLVVGHCLDFGDASLPYLPFTEIFGQLQAEAPAEIAAIAQRHRAIHRLLPAERRLPEDSDEVSGHVARTELFDAVARAFDRLAAGSPESGTSGVVIVIEDLHWADPSSRDLLTYLLSRRFEHPVSLVVSYRSDDLVRSHPLRAALANWSRLDQVDRIDLPPLPDRDVGRLVAGLRPDLPRPEVQAVIDRAEGNAFFAEELTAAADVRGVPADLAGLLLLRLDVLSDAARHVVRAASVAGRKVGHELLAEVAELPAGELDIAIRGAVEGQVLVGRDDGYVFRHALLGEAVYDDLLPGERVRFHARYVAALTAPGSGGTAAELARHARASHDNATAISASIAAGDEALRVGGPDDALRHYRHALELVEHQPIPDVSDQDTAVIDLTIRASEAAEAAGHLDQAINLLRDRLQRRPADSGLDPVLRARLLQSLASSLLYSDYDLDERALLSEAVDLIDKDRDRSLHCRLLATMARSFVVRGRYEDAIECAHRAIALAKELSLQRIIAEQTILLAKIKQRLGDPDASIKQIERVLAGAVADGDSTTELRAAHQLGTIRFEQGKLTEALATYERAADRAAASGRRWSPYGLDAVVMAAQTAFSLGDWDHAIELSAEREQVPSLARANLDLTILSVRSGRGELEGLRLLPGLRRWWGYDSMVTINCIPAIELHALGGDLAAACALYDDMVTAMEAVNGPHFIGRVRLNGVLLDVLTRSAAGSDGPIPERFVDRADEALDGARAAMADFEKTRKPGPEAYAWQARTEAEYLRFRSVIGRPAAEPAELVGCWRRAVAGFVEYPHRFEHARSQARLAAALLTGGDRTATSQAAELIDAATATAARLGARPLLAELGALGSDRTGPPSSNPLTAREREVLGLVAEGLSNRDIGGRLVISTKTASVHVSNIMAKLAAESRTEAVAIARRTGLIG
ncbi:helix-turn-helix transcriptional regulator [Microlunatus soli]|uniref:Tetratricopeptide repeat-containing protein n=1 Tax=Microlunatus soli TaxID=630515 RepID=A0A1H1X0N6_9ACTN|nr:AAA family ATPase [Microlunatus soli]SDT02089.1 Tetratricopeptide repeat-containing protein [Microlunatus soli]